MVQRIRLGSVLVSSGIVAFVAVACGHANTPTAPSQGTAGTPPTTPGTAGTGSPPSGGGTGPVGSGGSGNAPVNPSGGKANEVELPTGGTDSATAGGGGTSSSGGGAGPTAGTGPEPACTDTTLTEDPAIAATRPGYTAARSPEVQTLLTRMSLEQKVKQLYGIANPPTPRPQSAWNDIQRSDDVDLGGGQSVRGYRYRDAGRGLNLAARQHDRPTANKDYSTVFPAQSVRAASWDLETEYKVGVALGDETMASKNTMMLAPCMNIIRHPYWGRTQETYSEDMYHTGRMASALTAGIQQHVIACPKHYAANNIENNRENQNATMNEQTLREVYGRHFEMVVRDGGAGCIMASYNLVNGKKATQNKHLLTTLLRGPVDKGGMAFRGVVLTDWWAMPGSKTTPDVAAAQADAIEALQAGLDIEVPWAQHYDQLPALVSSGKLTSAEIDAAAGRVLEQKFRFNHVYMSSPYGLGTAKTRLEGDSIAGNEDHLALAEEAEIRSAVLLKNGDAGMPVLPIKDPVKTIAVVGPDVTVTVSGDTDLPVTGRTMRMAIDVNTGDRGSSRANHDPAKAIGPFDGIKAAAEAKGMTVTSGNTAGAAMAADFVVVVVGLTAGDEGEEYSLDSKGDRKDLNLTQNQNAFVESVLALNKPTAIIVQSGSVVNLPWLAHPNKRQATVWAGYGGQRVGAALGKLLLGDRNFSGKMPMAWPTQQTIDSQMFASGGLTTNMGYFFGYREYDRLAAAGMKKELVFPFGHGLSYTTFAYSNLQVPCGDVAKNAVVPVTVEVRNTGTVDGDEVVLLFVAPPPKPAGIAGDRPVKEVKGFYKVNLKAGAGKRVTIPLKIDDLRRWEGDASGQYVIDPGTYTVMVGPSGDDSALTLKDTFTIK